MKKKINSYKKLTIFTIILCQALLLLPSTRYAEETGDFVHYRLGMKYKEEKKYEQAIEEFRKVLAVYPDNYNSYMHIAEIRVSQQRSRLAIYNLKKALAYNPGWSKAQKMLAFVYEQDGQFHNAVKELQDYLQYCDPAEKDSVQQSIDRLISIIKDGGVRSVASKPAEQRGAQTDTSGGSAAEPQVTEQRPSKDTLQSQQAEKPATAQKKIVRGRAVKNKEAEKEFQAGIAAYADAVSTQGTSRFDKAIAHFRNTLRLEPGHAGAYYYAGLIRRRLGQNKMAMINFGKSIDYPELGYNAHFYLGKIYAEEGNYAEAINHLKAYIGKTSYQPGIQEAKNLIAQYTNAYDATRKKEPKINIHALVENDIHREISTIPQQPLFAAMEIRIDSLLSMSVVDTLSNPGQEMLSGVRLFTDNRYDDAIARFKELLVKYPNGDIAARCLYNIGVCYMKLRNFNTAEHTLQQILDHHASHSLAAKSLFLKALSYAERQEPAQAEKLFRTFIQRYRNHGLTAKAYEMLGDAYSTLLQDKKAIDAYNQAATISRSSEDKVHALFKLGNAYLKVDNTTRAIEAFDKAIAVGEKSNVYVRVPDSHYKVADVLYKKKDFKQALKYYQKATRQFPTYQDTPWGIFQIGSIYKNIKEFDKAIEAFNELIKTYPDDYWAKQAQWKREDTVWEYEYRAVLK